MKVVKILVGIVLLYAISRAFLEEGGKAKNPLTLIVLLAVVAGLFYLLFKNYFNKNKVNKKDEKE